MPLLLLAVPLVLGFCAWIEAMAGPVGSDMASGGMATKLAAARIALDAGCSMAIADGRRSNPIAQLETLDDGTWFITQETPAQARKRWIAGGLNAEGEVRIDQGAANALRQGKSLLPVGAISISGAFERGGCLCLSKSNDIWNHRLAGRYYNRHDRIFRSSRSTEGTLTNHDTDRNSITGLVHKTNNKASGNNGCIGVGLCQRCNIRHCYRRSQRNDQING